MITDKTVCKRQQSILYLTLLSLEFVNTFAAIAFVIFVDTISITDNFIIRDP